MFPPLQHWLPSQLVASPTGWQVRWLHLGEQRFLEPFFDETLTKCLALPANSQRQRAWSSLDFLADAVETVDTLEPTAFIFHVSRCGSTLLTQWLSLLDRHVVVPECPLIDEVWRLQFAPPERQVPEADRLRYLQAAIQWTGQRRWPEQQHFFVKLDSWHTLLFDDLRRLYSNTPCVFLYREPEAVLRSHARQPGAHAVPGFLEPAIFGWSEQPPFTTLPAYTSAVIERIYEGMLAASARCDKGLLLNYNTGMLDNFAQLIDFLGLKLSPEEWAAVEQRSQFHSKRPGQTFAEPVENRQPLSTDHLLSTYVRLEGLRHRTVPAPPFSLDVLLSLA